MAWIETRKSKDGKVTTYRVKWRTGGGRTGPADGRTFDSQPEAKKFKGLIDAHGQQWPPAEVLLQCGFGYLLKGAFQEQSAELETPVPPVTFKAFALGYVDRLVKPNRETKRKYLERLEKHVFPTLGHRPIAEITRREMREWQNGLINTLAAKTIKNIRGEAVSPVFDAACLPGEDGEAPLRNHNPLKGLPAPDGARAIREILDDRSEAQIVLRAAYEIDPNAADLLLTLLATGMRWGEVAGLPVRSINKNRGTVSIMQVLRREYGVWRVVEQPKTPDGYREIPVPPSVFEVIQERCEDRPRDSFIFTSPGGSFWRYESFYRDRWIKVRDLAVKRGLEKQMTMYGLRHSLLTWLASEHIDLATLRSIAGHKKISTTFDIYVHNHRRNHGKVKDAVSGLIGTTVPR